MTESESMVNTMSLEELRHYCKRICVENRQLRQVLEVFQQIKQKVVFVETLINSSDISTTDPTCDAPLVGPTPEAQAPEVSGDESETDLSDNTSEPEVWEPKRRSTNGPKNSRKRHKHVIYSPAERTQSVPPVLISGQQYDCMASEDGLFRCQFTGCGKQFTQRYSLRVHYGVHGADKKYQCFHQSCGRKFTDKSSFNRHLVVHSNTRPYVCDWPSCAYRCNDASALRVHKRRHTGERPYACDWPGCAQSFISSSRATEHKRTHTGEKPFGCNWPGCGFSAGSAYKVKTHQLIHTLEKPLCCEWPECTFRTKTISDLNRHRIKHTGDKSLKCKECDFTTGYTSVLTRHLKRKHLK